MSQCAECGLWAQNGRCPECGRKVYSNREVWVRYAPERSSVVQLNIILSNQEAEIVVRVAERVAKTLVDEAIHSSDDDRDRTTAALAVFRREVVAPLIDHEARLRASAPRKAPHAAR